MKTLHFLHNLIFFGFLFLSFPSSATVYTVTANGAKVTIPAEFSGTASLLGLPTTITQIDSVMVDNFSLPIALNCSTTPSKGVPTRYSPQNIYVSGSEAWVTAAAGFGTQCYLRSNIGPAITSSGEVVITVIGRGNP